jgi:hypothetical protein
MSSWKDFLKVVWTDLLMILMIGTMLTGWAAAGFLYPMMKHWQGEAQRYEDLFMYCVEENPLPGNEYDDPWWDQNQPRPDQELSL